MIPSLWREAGEQGRSNKSYMSLGIAMVIIFALLISLKVFSISIIPNFGWYVFCGFCLALSVIAPGMSFSTLLMPLGLYTPFVDAIGSLNFNILIPSGIGAFITVIALAKGVNALFERHYSVSFHAIVGIVIAATIMIIPVSSFVTLSSTVINLLCFGVGIVCALLLDKFNSSVSREQ
jgi:putative membrane protein